MNKEELKKEYKKAIKLNLDNIKENIDDIIDFAFKNNTKKIEIKVIIEPDKIIDWECKTIMSSITKENYFMYLKGDNNDWKRNGKQN